ncbi:hypothetical protein EV284_4165 [Streptomyces sp. BK022]|nr:hypothetical protein [Streptomyces sp. BK022]RZU36669.1 hypothetical protein EV284_4165 [Streptomyces sp. BK022]
MTTAMHLSSRLAVDALDARPPLTASGVPGVGVALFAEAGPGARG